MNYRRPFSQTAVIVLLLSAFCLVPSVFSQTATATLSGTVTDQNGAVVPSTNVSVVNNATGLKRDAVTNDEGYFTVPLLQPGAYTVRAQHDGFKIVQVDNVILNVGDQKTIQIPLQTGDVSETVNVTGEAPLIDTSGAVGTVVNRQFVENIPLNGRSFQTLFELTPGVTIINTPTGSGLNVNGQRDNTNYLTIDGVSGNTGISSTATPAQTGTGRTIGYTAQGTTASLVAVDALQEFRIQTSTFAPEFGRAPGGQISLVTRSGENKFHGGMFESLRNDALDATDWFINAGNLAPQPLRQHQFGGTLGGPILFPSFGEGSGDRFWRGKDKLFFFLSYEGLRLTLPKAQIIEVPSVATRQAAHPLIRPFLELLPIPNGPTVANGYAQFAGSWTDKSQYDATSLRIDYNLTSEHRFFSRYSDTPSFTKNRTSSLNTIRISNQINRSLTAGLTSLIGTGVSNDFRINYTQNRAPSAMESDDLGGAKLPPLDPFGTGSSPENTSYSVLFSVGPSASVLWGTAGDLAQRQLNITDNVSVAMGNHSLKIGIDFLRSHPKYRGEGGLRSESIVFANNDLAGPRARVFTITQFPDSSQSVAYDALSVFAQDTWRVTPRLTLTYGLRWELVPPPHVIEGEEPITIANTDDPYGGQVHLNAQGTPLWRTRYTNFAPRVGASYVISHKTGQELIVRGGFGLFYDLGFGGVSSVYFQYPLTALRTCPGGVGCPAGTSVPLPLPPSVISTPSFFDRPSLLAAVDPELRLPLVYQWNVALERSLGAHQKVSVNYVASEGRRLLKVEDFRGVRFREWPAPQPAGRFNLTRNRGYSDYYALQAQYQRRLHRGFQALASYTLGRSRDTASTDGLLISPRLNTNLEFGYSDFDMRHVVTGAVTYEMPRVRGHWLVRSLVNGWAIDTIFRYRTGIPINVTATGTFNDPSFPVVENPAVRANVVPGQPFWTDDPRAPGGRRLNRLAFDVVPPNTIGNLPRGAVRGFAHRQVDVSLRRDFRISETARLQLRAEVFNITNTPNFRNPTGNVTALPADPVQRNNVIATFGGAQSMANQAGGSGPLSPLYSTGGPRSVQLSARVIF